MDPAALEERTNEMRERLDLTDKQVEAIEPILIDHMEKTGAVLKEYGIDLQSGERPKERMGFREARKMKSELDGVQSKTEGALDDILDVSSLLSMYSLKRKLDIASRVNHWLNKNHDPNQGKTP
jgi:hypothetical protein